MTTRERFHATMGFGRPDRLPMVEWATYWDKTVDRWLTEGLPQQYAGPDELRDFAGLDCWRQYWARPRGAECPRPPSHGAGILRTEDEYEALLPCLYPDPQRMLQAIEPWAQAHARGDMVVWLTLEGFFWYPRTLFGIQGHLYAFYDEPDLMHRMNRDLLAWNLRTIDHFCTMTTPDFATLAEDMSYNHGPMLSRELFDEFIAPYYRDLAGALERRGIIPIVDSDGDVTELVPWLESAGLRGILPLERMAGVDVRRLRRDHPRLLMIGAFDKTVMHRGEAAMRQEFERLLPTMRSGGFIPSVDHQTPPDVSWKTYHTYLRLLAEYAEKGAPR